MKLYDNFITHTNPDASGDLYLTVRLESSVPMELMIENARVNSRLDLPWVNAVEPHDGVALICGKAPSLKKTWPTILGMQEFGGTVFACNSSAKYLHGKGIRIENQVFIDALQCCETEWFPADRHLLASIVNPVMFAMSANAVLWHPLITGIEDVIPAGKEFSGIGGGITVTVTTACLAYTLGYREIHVFGMDSSFDDGERYAIPEYQDQPLVVDVEHAGKTYRTAYDLKMQVIVFMKVVELLEQSGCRIEVHGTGLLPDVFYNRESIKDLSVEPLPKEILCLPQT